MQNGIESLKLHDIKPLLEVQEYSFYYFLAIVIFTTLIFLGVVYLFLRWLKSRKKFSKRKEDFKALVALDLNNTKKSAYGVSLYGATFKDDSPRHKEMYENVVQRLEAYKYKKEVEPFDDEVRSYIELYKGMIDV